MSIQQGNSSIDRPNGVLAASGTGRPKYVEASIAKNIEAITQPILLRTCSLIRNETATLFYHGTNFKIYIDYEEVAQHMRIWLDKIGEPKRQALQKVTFKMIEHYAIHSRTRIMRETLSCLPSHVNATYTTRCNALVAAAASLWRLGHSIRSTDNGGRSNRHFSPRMTRDLGSSTSVVAL